MRLTPISAEKANEGGSFPVWKPGEYDYEIHDAADDTSKSGAEMLKLTLYVFDSDGNKRTVFDYITSDEKSQWKARHLAESVGLVKQYESGELDPYDLTGKTGRLKLRIKPAQGDYPAGNSVGDYIPIGDLPEKATRSAPRPAARPAVPARQPSQSTIDDDSIPF